MSKKSTGLIHHPYRAPEGFASPVVPVAKASTVLFRDMAHLRQQQWVDKSGYTYGLHGTPTTFTLEARLASLEGAAHALLTPSGLSAIAVVDQAVLSSGDHLLIPDNAYAPNRALARHELARWGISHDVYDALDVASLRRALRPNTKLVWVEAPGSITMEFPDLPGLVKAVRDGAPQAVVALDNTWGAGLAFDAFELGQGLSVDLTIHALTKYPSGGGDVLMGSICVDDRSLHDQLAWTHSRLGVGVGANDVEVVLRSLPTMALRYAAQDEAARSLASWCAGQPGVRRVLHPALRGSPGHEHWASLCRAAAGIFSIEVEPRFSAARVDAFVESLTLFGIGWSWGGALSLAVPYDTKGLRSLRHDYEGVIVRLSIGLEDVEDLRADLAQGLARLVEG
ncbi:MAG: cystathionine beta-lyase [Betaproteobacteria bacterium]|jgi:cysteine-S-conjugate beta-lyase|nr:cystathionine beta-lyase [Betaproteobacteria bacterium]NBT11456.1 cystathionine beta-lyase [Betaproteobacteria bacterium]NBU50268.1 cystathionine beta-lyase [Betaproteobacteria bacterium]NBX96884.1 cystathionine beta-lyase [Betaproteobacteria bacterium]